MASPQKGERAAHLGGFLLEIGVAQGEVANAFHQRGQGGYPGPEEDDVHKAPAPGAHVELVDADAAQQQGQHASGNLAFGGLWGGFPGGSGDLGGVAVGAGRGELVDDPFAASAERHGFCHFPGPFWCLESASGQGFAPPVLRTG